MAQSPTARYPAIYELATKKAYPLGTNATFEVGKNQTAQLPILDRACSGRQFRLVRQGATYLLEALSQSVPTYCNGEAVKEPTTLEHGAVIKAGASQFCYLEHDGATPMIQTASPAVKDRAVSATQPVVGEKATTPSPPRSTNDAPPRGQDKTVIGRSTESALPSNLSGRIPLTDKVLIGRDAAHVQVPLLHEHVSRVHAQISTLAGATVVTDLNSSNGTFVNGRRITGPVTIKRGDRIDIGPYRLVFDGTGIIPSSRANNIELICTNLSRTVKDRNTGQPVTLLDDITLVIRPREFVCILGPSGSGKSTLLSALSARVPADAGQVIINGEDFYGAFDALKQDVAVVPQQEALHEPLSVMSALHYTAQLRLPPDLNDGERRSSINEILTTVNLVERATTRFEHLSGGQRKRASLANEILSRPSLLFLDEVTSGLDEQTDSEMMRLFRQISDNGKTVVCITHSLANVERTCHLVVILTAGGKLAFVGSPHEARQYFGIERLGDVYERLAEKSPEEWKQAFAQHALYSKYIDSRLPTADDRQTSAVPPCKPTWRERFDIFRRQTRILTNRYLRIQLSDRRSLGMMVGQCLLVAVLLVMFFGDLSKTDPDRKLPVENAAGDVMQIPEPANMQKAASSSKMLFLLVLSCLWLGCNNAAKEIVKERVIYTRERDINVLVPSYYASKLILLGVISLAQVTVLLATVKTFCGLPGNTVAEWIFLSTVAMAGVTLGLLISAVSNSNDMAVSIIPLALIPQIILAGVIAPVEGAVGVIAHLFITAYWGYQGIVALLPEEMLEVLRTDDHSAFASYCVILAHVMVFVVMALGVLLLGDPSLRRTRRKLLEKILSAAR